MHKRISLQFGAKIQHQEAFVNSFNPFFDFRAITWPNKIIQIK
jgi:hypothetical protein